MDMTFTPEEIAFRQQVRQWLQQAMPAAMKRKADNGGIFDQDETKEWHKILYDQGWIAPNWPEKHGGTGWDVARRFIFGEELVRANAPQLSPFGLGMVGPLLIQYGTTEQQQRFLPKILSGD
jgi:alkylation response protein AidB-like acyl-CoA dehydrogenase